MKHRTIGIVAGAFAALLAVSIAAAQAPDAVRVRGTIAGVDGNMLDVKSRDGTPIKVKLADNVKVLAVDVTRLPGHAIVTDLVYVPVLTPLLAAAKTHGLRTADGLGMLLHQAVRGFALWFGKTPEVTAELRMLVEADLGSSHTKRSR